MNKTDKPAARGKRKLERLGVVASEGWPQKGFIVCDRHGPAQLSDGQTLPCANLVLNLEPTSGQAPRTRA